MWLDLSVGGYKGKSNGKRRGGEEGGRRRWGKEGLMLCSSITQRVLAGVSVLLVLQHTLRIPVPR